MAFSKKRLLRFLMITEWLKSGRRLSNETIAEMLQELDSKVHMGFACTPGTVKNDIKALKTEFSAPIEFDASKKEYFLTDLQWKFLGTDVKTLAEESLQMRKIKNA